MVVGIFLVTAMFGRVWCGWMCPQTVYLEFIYRPLERLFDGPPGRRHANGAKGTPLRTIAEVRLLSRDIHVPGPHFPGLLRWRRNLAQWVRSSPIEHPAAFVVMALTTGAMMFDFAFFREQTCIVACPYGRFQSVMLDRDSLIVSYDPNRGEPRGKGRRKRPTAPRSVIASTAATAWIPVPPESISATACSWNASPVRSASMPAMQSWKS